MNTSQTYKCVIIGTGPAGLTAALYTARMNLSPIVFEGQEPGGQLTLTTGVDNFPGFPDGIMGPELMDNMKKQAARFGAEYLAADIPKVDLSGRPFKISADNGKEYSAQTLIISTGASAKFLGLENEKELTGRGISTCAKCDGLFFVDQIIHVVGGGDTAMEDATYMTKYAKKVYVIHRRDTLRATKPMQQRAFENDKIEFIYNTGIEKILFDEGGVTGIEVKNLKTGEITQRETHGLFYGIGRTPNTKFLEGQIECDDQGFIKTHNGPLTNVPGVFACGDVQDNIYRQAITAAGSGCQAAIMAERFLDDIDAA